jgi:hypothetical protein
MVVSYSSTLIAHESYCLACGISIYMQLSKFVPVRAMKTYSETCCKLKLSLAENVYSPEDPNFK